MKNKQKKISLFFCLMTTAALLLQACSGGSPSENDASGEKTEVSDYSSFFCHDSVMDISIKIDEKDWQELKESPAEKSYYSCDISVNGTEVKEAGIRTKGNSTLDAVSKSDSDRHSFKVEFDHYHEGRLLNGLDKLILNNIYGDPSYMVEYEAYRINDYAGVPTPCHAFAFITVNGEPWGLYLAIEGIEEAFAERTGNTGAQIYKPENSVIDKFRKDPLPPGSSYKDLDGSLDGGANLVYRDDKIESYPNIFENAVFEPDEEAKKRCVEAIRGLNLEKDKGTYVDADECIKYLAALTFTNNPDSYYSQAVCNYYLMEKEGRLSMLPWDLNHSFCGAVSADAAFIINSPINDPWDTPLGFMIGYDSYKTKRPMFDSLAGSEEYRGKYYDELKNISEWTASESFSKEYKEIVEILLPYIEKDTTFFYDIEEVPSAQQRLLQYIQLRAKSVLSQIEGSISPYSKDRRGTNSTVTY